MATTRRARSSSARWEGLSDRAQVALLDRVYAALSEAFPGGVRARVDRARGWGIVELAGTGKRRLPGKRRDLRRYVLRAASDGRFLTASFSVDGDLVDSASFAAPTAADVEEVGAFFARHAPRVWWKGPAALGEAGPAPSPRSKVGGSRQKKEPAASGRRGRAKGSGR
jgi:hypothetical protein